MEQQLHNANNNNQAMTASNKQLEQQRQSLTEQLHTTQQACQEAQTQLRDQQAAFEEESASMHNLASRHKEERASLEKDKQNLDALKEELLKTVEVSVELSCRISFVACQRLWLFAVSRFCVLVHSTIGTAVFVQAADITCQPGSTLELQLCPFSLSGQSFEISTALRSCKLLAP